MAAECFCGCGREIPFRWRPVNTRGKDLQESIAEVKASPGRGRKGIDHEYIDEAERACRRLAEAIHTQGEADKQLERETRELLKQHKRRYGNALFGRFRIERRR